MKRDILVLLFIAGAAASQQTSAAAVDRHPGIYQFAPISPSACVGKERERRLAPQRERLRKLGDLPPAYVIRLAEIQRPAARPFAAPGFDPCGGIERVK